MANPYITTTITCAAPNCGKTKGENNHWFLAFIKSDVSIQISVWDERVLRDYADEVSPLCGDACVIKMVSMYLSDQKSKAQGGQQQ